jgi:hypothetical protein
VSYVRVESTVRLHPKFLKAGPAASWLWFCGQVYSESAKTGGFIPVEAVQFLGVSSPGQLVKELVAAGIWEPIEGGWRVVRVRKEQRRRSRVRRFLDRLLAFWGQACVYCGVGDQGLQVEHIIPSIRGGSDELGNLTLACPTCNQKKARLTAAEFGYPHIHELAKGLQ